MNNPLVQQANGVHQQFVILRHGSSLDIFKGLTMKSQKCPTDTALDTTADVSKIVLINYISVERVIATASDFGDVSSWDVAAEPDAGVVELWSSSLAF